MRNIVDLARNRRKASRPSIETKKPRKILTPKEIVHFFKEVQGQELTKGWRFEQMVRYRSRRLSEKFGWLMIQELASADTFYLWKIRGKWALSNLRRRKGLKKHIGIKVLIKGYRGNPMVLVTVSKFNNVQKWLDKQGHFICPICSRLRGNYHMYPNGICAFCNRAYELENQKCQYCGKKAGLLEDRYGYLSRYGYDFTKPCCDKCKNRLTYQYAHDNISVGPRINRCKCGNIIRPIEDICTNCIKRKQLKKRGKWLVDKVKGLINNLKGVAF